jgi:hypothetical protein
MVFRLEGEFHDEASVAAARDRLHFTVVPEDAAPAEPPAAEPSIATADAAPGR